MVVLGIETTCDETAAAVVERPEDGRGAILSNIVLSQVASIAAFGGVVPEIAARAHVEALDALIAEAHGRRRRAFEALDGVAAAAGPGLIGGVIVGAHHRQGDRAGAATSRLIAVNHLEGARAHGAAHRRRRRFPIACFSPPAAIPRSSPCAGVGDYVRLGTTIDDAIGEAFDKTAKLLGLGYPGGPQVEKEAAAAAMPRASRCRGR